MDTYINLNTRFKLNKTTKELIDLETGQIYTDKEEIQEVLKILKEDKEFNKTIEKAIRDTWGIKTKPELCQLGWKEKSWFIKVYRTEMRKYKEQIKLSANAGLLLFYMQDYIEYETNKIAKKDGNDFTNKELQELAGMSNKTLNKAMNELEDKKFIVRLGITNSREIYFNPYLMCSGNEVLKSTIKLFDDVGYKPITPF